MSGIQTHNFGGDSITLAMSITTKAVNLNPAHGEVYSIQHHVIKFVSNLRQVGVRGKRFSVCTEIAIILGTARFTIRGGRLRYKRYDAHFLKKVVFELPFSSFGDHLIHILRKVNRLIYAFRIN
jgi:hypothetical protein